MKIPCATGLIVLAASLSLIATFAPTAALAQSSAVPAAASYALTVYGGYRGGGSFEQVQNTDSNVDIDSGAAWSLSLDIPLDTSRRVQLFASTQSTDLAATTTSPSVPLTVSYLHLGGTNFFEGGVGRGPYVVGGLGVTRLAPGLSGLSAEFRPSMNLGLGWQLPLAAALSLRLEVRGYFTLINSQSALFCSGGCVIAVRGDGLVQGEAMVGLSYAF
ncbi:MAG: hypothetical protein ABIR94_18845 [Rubrivivax sp.]